MDVTYSGGKSKSKGLSCGSYLRGPERNSVGTLSGHNNNNNNNKKDVILKPYYLVKDKD